MKATIATLICILVLLVAPFPANAQTPAPSEPTPSKIPQIVADTLNAAVPGVGSIVKVIADNWPKKSNGEPKKIDQETMLQKLEAAKTQIEADVKQQANKRAADKLAGLIHVVNELEVIESYWAPTIVAKRALQKATAVLESATFANQTQLSEEQWRQVKIQWSKVPTNLSRLQQPDLGKIRYAALRERLRDINEANSDLKIEIDSMLSQTPAQLSTDLVGERFRDSKDKLEKLSDTVNRIDGIIGEEVVNLTNELKQAVPDQDNVNFWSNLGGDPKQISAAFYLKIAEGENPNLD